MTDRLRRVAATAVGVMVTAPLLVLPVRAAADTWRAPALLPQRWGVRGIEAVLTPGTRVGEAVVRSLLVATVTTAIALVAGWPAARTLATAAGRRRTVLLGLLGLPLLVPPFAAGVGLTRWLLALGVADGVPALVLAHLVYVLPYTTLTLAPAFTAEIRALEEAAATAGAGRWARLRLVTLPSAAAAAATAGLLGFVVSWSQYGTSLAVGGGRLTLPVVLLPFVERDPQIASTLALVLLLPPLVALLAVGRLLGPATAAGHPAAATDASMTARTSSIGG